MIGKAGAKVPAHGTFTDADKAILAAADGLINEVRAAMDDFALHNMLAAIWRVVADANRYFAGEEPWKLKDNPARRDTVLYTTIEVLRNIAILTQPVTPTASGKLLDLLNVPADARGFSEVGETGRLNPGQDLPPPAPVFPRYVEAEEGAKA
jgi:methionyl-tRNA synthetase